MLTVIEPAPSGDIVDISAVRAAMGLADQSEDIALAGFLSRASDVIARHCKRTFGLETVAETFRPEYARECLILERYPVVAVTSIISDGSQLAPEDYEVDANRGFVSRLFRDRVIWWPGGNKVVVTYAAGYDLPADAPPALQQACIQLVKAYYMGSDRDPMVRSEGVEAISNASYFGGADLSMPPDVLALLKQFRKLK